MLQPVRIKPIQRELEVLIASGSSAQVRANYARRIRDEAIATNTKALGRSPAYETFVDGVEGIAEEQVKPNGRIVYSFDLGNNALAAILTLLQKYSPVRSGSYANTHELFADGVQVLNPNDPPPALEYVFMNLRPYSRKIEGTIHSGGKRAPQSSQAPDGVYNVVAAMANRQFGNVARIRFGYRTALGGAILTGREGNKSSDRNPAIVVSMR